MENGIGMKLCWIPAGKFQMGDKKKVDVELTRGFWLGKYEVTQEEYEEVMGTNPAKFKKAGKRAPVEQVNWHEAMEFCGKLTGLEQNKGTLPHGWKYTLPTEARWELGWYKKRATHEAGQKKANAWGLHDMHGNVRERAGMVRGLACPKAFQREKS